MQNYEIIRKLGQGSYGSVYLARQRDSGRQCVMKRMVLRQLNEKERQSAFQEARILRELSHPNIVAYIDTQATASKLYLFMQFCDGGDLEQRLAQLKKDGGVVPQTQLLDWFVQMALALQYLHSRRMLHRDLKTANVFLTRRDIVKLVRPPAHAPQKQRLAAPHTAPLSAVPPALDAAAGLVAGRLWCVQGPLGHCGPG